GERGPVLAAGEGEKGQDQDGGQGHHGEDGHEGDPLFVLSEELAGLEFFRVFHGLSEVISRKRRRMPRLVNVLQCKLKEIQRLYKPKLPAGRFFCKYIVFTRPGGPFSGGRKGRNRNEVEMDGAKRSQPGSGRWNQDW